MLVLGFSGGPDVVSENYFGLGQTHMHDAAAVLVEDGEVVFAIEEERLNRIKHTNKAPLQGIRAGLERQGVRLKDVDVFAYYCLEKNAEFWLRKGFLDDPRMPELLDPATFFQRLFCRAQADDVSAGKFQFVHHHLAHAVSTFALSGFESGLILTFDGAGDGSSGMVLEGGGQELKPLANFPIRKSLGNFYLNVIAYLGYKLFDEYKVMGLAPYGDPERYRGLFRSFYTLLPEGDYEIHGGKIAALFDELTPRRKDEPFSQVHMDIAAALQESLEEVAFHVIRHYRETTGLKSLCLAGGVSHNCTLNGKILRSGMFERVFVQPASHDAGCALGAALYAYYGANPSAARPAQIKHVYWGTDVGGDDAVLSRLLPWRDFVEFERVGDVTERAAELLARDRVVGWVQGRSEFGPRALGNRSILADPRPAKNKDRINQLVKKREGYRPFAPAVLLEEAERFFEVRADREPHNFMLFVVKVREEQQRLLGAVTHVDGTARVQTVTRETNAKFWDLIRAFGERTGVPILLNTSFNNNAEPIVDSVEDAVVCFLTTGLDYLVVGDYLVKKKEISWRHYLELKADLPPHVSLNRVKRTTAEGRVEESCHLGVSYDARFRHEVSQGLADALGLANTGLTLKEMLEEACPGDEDGARAVVEELTDVWSHRLLVLRP